MKDFYIEVVKFGDPEEVVRRIGPMSERSAYRVDNGMSINLNHAEYYTRIVQV